MGWEAVEAVMHTSAPRAIVWDGCHKIYIPLDDEQMALFDTGWTDSSKVFVRAGEQTPDEMLATMHDWFDRSCPLRLIDSVRTVAEGVDPNFGYTQLIRQFEFDEPDEDDETEED